MIMVCGEALMDVFALAETATGFSLDARIGGSPFNVAIGLARLGQPVTFFGAISTGFLGERVMRALKDEGVVTSSVERVDAPTTLSLVGLDANGIPNYAFYGEGGADRQLNVEAVRRVPPTAAAIHVGSFATVVEPVASTLRSLIEREGGRVLVSYDPNVRLSVEPDRARWRATLDWMLSRSDIVKISEEDLALLYPGVASESFIERALASGASLVVNTRGESGSVAATASTRISVSAIPVSVADTVGAGDSFQAALLTWLAENDALAVDALVALSHQRLADALRFASRAASLTCGRRGANLPTRAELAAISTLGGP